MTGFGQISIHVSDSSCKLLQSFISQIIKESMEEKLRALPSFNWNAFKKLPFEQLENYALDNLEELGSGSSRRVFLLSSGKVLKIAVNKAGVAQNKAEIDAWTTPGVKNIIAAVYDAHPKYWWLVSELAKTSRTGDIFNRYFEGKQVFPNHGAGPIGYFEEMLDVFENASGNLRQRIERTISYMIVNEFMSKDANMSKIADFLASVWKFTKMTPTTMDDIKRADHYGLTADGRLVIIDYGFTEEVGQKYYGYDNRYPNLDRESTTRESFSGFQPKSLTEILRSFNLNHFKSLRGNLAKIAYASKILPHMGEGSSRTVFAVSGDKALKIAKNQKGIGQNEAEVNMFLEMQRRGFEKILATAIDYDPKYTWVLSEVVRPLSYSKKTDAQLFEQKIGMSFDIFALIIEHMRSGLQKAPTVAHERLFLTQNTFQEMQKAVENPSALLEALHFAVNNLGLDPMDLVTLQHYGIASDGRIVLLDYGYTEDVKLRYYE